MLDRVYEDDCGLLAIDLAAARCVMNRISTSGITGVDLDGTFSDIVNSIAREASSSHGSAAWISLSALIFMATSCLRLLLKHLKRFCNSLLVVNLRVLPSPCCMPFAILRMNRPSLHNCMTASLASISRFLASCCH